MTKTGYTDEDDEYYEEAEEGQNGKRKFRPGDVVIVEDMPFHDRNGSKTRPAVVLSSYHHNQARQDRGGCKYIQSSGSRPVGSEYRSLAGSRTENAVQSGL